MITVNWSTFDDKINPPWTRTQCINTDDLIRRRHKQPIKIERGSGKRPHLVMDVIYNHTKCRRPEREFCYCPDRTRIRPFLNADGTIEMSGCRANTANEHDSSEIQ